MKNIEDMDFDEIVRAGAVKIFTSLRDSPIEDGPVAALEKGLAKAFAIYDVWNKAQERLQKAA